MNTLYRVEDPHTKEGPFHTHYYGDWSEEPSKFRDDLHKPPVAEIFIHDALENSLSEEQVKFVGSIKTYTAVASLDLIKHWFSKQEIITLVYDLGYRIYELTVEDQAVVNLKYQSLYLPSDVCLKRDITGRVMRELYSEELPYENLP